MESVLKAIKAFMAYCNVEYEFEQWSGGDVDTYWVSEYHGYQDTDESGFSEHAPILSGFADESNYQKLLSEAETIRKNLLFGFGQHISSDRVIIFSQSINSIPQQDNIKRIEITLKVLAWEGVTNG